MEAVVNIFLPLEAVRAIQAGELVSVLHGLSTVPTGPYHLIYHIASKVAASVNTVPYNITPKAHPADTSGLVHDFSTTSLQDGGRWNTPSTSQQPNSKAPSAVDGSEADSEYGILDLTVRDLMNKEEHFSGFGLNEVFQRVADCFEERSGLVSSGLSFTYCGREIFRDVQLKDLGLHDGAVILVKPKDGKTTHKTGEITVIIQDSMKSEKSIVAKSTMSLHELMIMYEEATGLAWSMLEFSLGYKIIGKTVEDQLSSLAMMGIVTGSTIKVTAAHAYPRTCTLTFRDQMLNEEIITLCDQACLMSYIDEYQNRKGADFCYSAGYYGRLSSGMQGISLADLGIFDRSVIDVHPLATTAKVAHAESVVSLASVSSGRTRQDIAGW